MYPVLLKALISILATVTKTRNFSASIGWASSKVTKPLAVVSFAAMTLTLAACGGGSGSAATESDSGSASGPADLSGTISVAGYAAIDTDVEAPCNGLFAANNDIADPQFITNPVTLGGYISGTNGDYSNRTGDFIGCPETGYAADLKDYFQVVLVEDQTLALSVFYADNVDALLAKPIELTLRLLDPNNVNAEVSSLDILFEGTSTLTIPASQDFIIELSATAGRSAPLLYSLSLSQSVSSGAGLGLSAELVKQLNANFVPGEVLVKYHPPAVAEQSRQSAQRLAPIGSATSAALSSLVKMRDVGSVAELHRIDVSSLVSAMSFERTISITDAMKDKWRTLQAIDLLKQDPSVLFAEPNYLMRATGTISSPADIGDARYAQQWNAPMIGLPAAWQVTSGEGATVAVIDTGIHGTHADLNDNIRAGGYDFVLSEDIEGDGTGGRDNNPEDPGSTFHGSHVAGIIAAEGNTIGIRGVAYDAGIIPLRALGSEGVGSTADIAEAVLYAAGLVRAGGQELSEPVDVINLSLGSPDDSSVLRIAVARAIEAGSIVVAAAGNDSSSQLFYPAAYPDVIAVSSVDETKSRSSFSNFGTHIDVAAPGGTGSDKPYSDGFQDGILSTVFASEYAELRGTSMAAPHVSGVIALMKDLNPTLTPAGFATLLNTPSLITDNVDMPGFTAADNARFFGNGLINASKAVAIASGADIPDTLIVSPAQLGFVGGNTEAVLRLSNPGVDLSGDGDIHITSITSSDADLLSLTPALLGDGLGDYNVAIDISRVIGNITSATITIDYELSGVAQDAVEVPVFVSRSAVASATVGNLNVYLVSWEDIEAAETSGDTLIEIYDSVGGVLSDGAYSFSFNDIPEGLYLLEASTDNDGDFIWFDLGEAKGGYPLLSQPRVIEVKGDDLIGLDFEVGYSSFLAGAGLSWVNDGNQISGVTRVDEPESESAQGVSQTVFLKGRRARNESQLDANGL